MSKKPVRKAIPKKTKKAAAKKVTRPTKAAKKPLSDKEREVRAANLIANSEKKKKVNKRPKKTVTKEETSSLLDAIVEGMREKKARNIMIMNLSNIPNRAFDYFVICDADSKVHVESIADGIEETVLKLSGEKAYHSEGQQNSEWILIDYINIVAHVFLREMRDYYNLEALWGDAEVTLIND
ncbi:MAG: Iojap family protein [Bacteroidetes bacterium]|jgi:ribosome-associated protein|nr:Iojap family protein [Bacteroidota bacterium]